MFHLTAHLADGKLPIPHVPGRSVWLLVACLALPAHARIERSAAEVRAFRNAHPCPVTGRKRGACPGFQVDHTVALCAGGEDNASNMFWLSVEDHKFKTFTDVRECRKLRKLANRAAQ
jgi:hypothetical protein